MQRRRPFPNRKILPEEALLKASKLSKKKKKTKKTNPTQTNPNQPNPTQSNFLLLDFSLFFRKCSVSNLIQGLGGNRIKILETAEGGTSFCKCEGHASGTG